MECVELPSQDKRHKNHIMRHGLIVAQVMACCLTAPNQKLNQCWLIINTVQWYLSESNFTQEIPEPSIITRISLKITYIKFHSNPQWYNTIYIYIYILKNPWLFNLSMRCVSHDKNTDQFIQLNHWCPPGIMNILEYSGTKIRCIT